MAISGTVWAEQSHDCRCRAFGEKFELGAVACIMGELAQCQMALNNPSWQKLKASCPEARLDDLQPLLALLHPSPPSLPKC
jgi:hypothetical protein